jgi:hypothetical protein
LFPLSGPQKSFSQLDITGCGFWPSEDIIIKFSCIGGSGFAAPRSCPGSLKAAGALTCKPPRLGEAGTYEVTVAMDGSTFLPDKLYVTVYKDFSLLSISPAIVDRRIHSSSQFTMVCWNDFVQLVCCFLKFCFDLGCQRNKRCSEVQYYQCAHHGGQNPRVFGRRGRC